MSRRLRVLESHYTAPLARPATPAAQAWLRHLLGRRTSARLGFARDRIEIVVPEARSGALLALLRVSLETLGLAVPAPGRSLDELMREPRRRSP